MAKWISIATDWRLTDWADKLFPCTLEFTWTANVYCVDIKQCRLLSSVLLRSIARSSNQVMAESMYRVRKQDNCPSVGNEGTSSRIPREQAWLGELKRLTPAPRTTHWPPLHGLPYGLLHGLPYGLPLRTTLKNQPNSFYGVQKYKKLTCSSYTIITARKTAAIFSSYFSRPSL